MTKSVVILGAGWTGLPLAHKLLKYTGPKTALKVTLVTPNTHFFWNVAATRGLIPGEFTDDQLFLPIEPGFSRYPKGSFELVLGKAEKINSDGNTVSVELNNGSQQDVSYDHLVIATGSRLASDLPLKPQGKHEETLKNWHALQEKVGKSKDIVVAGSGPTGVEIAGEIAARCGRNKSVTLIINGNHTLESHKTVLASLRTTVEDDLVKLGVKIIRNQRVDKAIEDGAKTRISLSNGTEIVADCYLPTFGLKTNTSFVPREWLDSNGDVAVDGFMRVAKTTNVWSLGDVSSTEAKQITITDNQIIYLAKSLDATLTGGPPSKQYVPEKKTLIFISLGKSYATGQVGNWKLFGFLVAWVKGRKLFTDTAPAYVGGEKLRHSTL